MEKLNILIIEDSQDDYELCSRTLDKIFDCTSLNIRSAAKALELLTTQQFDLILLDYNLPDMNGLEFLKELKARGHTPTGPIIILTGQGNEEVAVNFLKLGASDYIIKGNISVQSLSRSIQNALTNFQAFKLANEKQQELYRFAQTITHDLRGPLGRINAYCKLSTKVATANEMLTKFIDNIDNDALHCMNFLDALFNYAEIGRSKAKMQAVNLNEVLDRSIKNLELDISENNASVSAQNMPEVYGDNMALTQLFQNLISNSIKYSDQKPQIEICAEPDKDYINIFLKDNGIGIPVEMANEVFKPFTRLKTGSDRKGIGLGLALCKTIIEQHNGSIEIRENIGGGTIFQIKFPNHA